MIVIAAAVIVLTPFLCGFVVGLVIGMEKHEVQGNRENRDRGGDGL